jgi:predicted phage tail protein
VNSLATDKVSWTNSKLVSGRTYAFRVRARTASTPGPYSNVVSVTLAPETGVPSAPTGLSLALSSSSPTSSVVVRWQDTSIEEDGFYVERSADGVTFAIVATRDVNRTSETNGGLSSGRQYWYRVRAFNATGPSAWTPTVSIRTQ